jgi:hypothetical protein
MLFSCQHRRLHVCRRLAGDGGHARFLNVWCYCLVAFRAANTLSETLDRNVEDRHKQQTDGNGRTMLTRCETRCSVGKREESVDRIISSLRAGASALEESEADLLGVYAHALN